MSEPDPIEPAPDEPRRPVEEHALAAKHASMIQPPKPHLKAKQPKPVFRAGWQLAAARTLHRWSPGEMLTRQQYDAAVNAAISYPIR